ncbi:unnamed protein product [Ilex paraguariensis]|uniref:non-specific serine/threonine protein kinase n=1 Tax=Ilex paraguariensis TaxID=185542 RepID=A0ABC8SLI0_9AQUA
MDNKVNVLMKSYDLGRLLGQGTFAKVYYARSLKTGESMAIKVIDKEKVLRFGLMEQIKREISVMRLVRHPNIVQLFEVMATKTKIYFVMEYAKGGELFSKVAKGRLKEDVARKYFQQLINAVDFCHSRVVYHRDLKPENLLLDENENLKVSDFGLSALAESKHQDGLLHTTYGTPAYVAPEIGQAEFKCPNGFPPERVRNSSNIDVPSGSCENTAMAAEAKQELVKISNLNAFDLISLFPGFDLSGLFEEPCLKKVARFTSWQPASVIISKLEEVAKHLRLKVSRRDGGLLKLEGMKEGRKGILSIDAEIFELAPSFHLVELKKSCGDTSEYQKMLKEGIRPGLQPIVGAWQTNEKPEQPL